jgi:hypothetical protein
VETEVFHAVVKTLGRKSILHWIDTVSFIYTIILSLPNEDFGTMNKDEIQIFEALFKGVSPRFGLRTIEKSVENPDFIFCQSFPNLRLGSINL